MSWKILCFMFLVVFILGSCTGRKRIPSGVLKQDQMIEVMSDILLAEGFSESYLYPDSTRKKEDWMNEEGDKVLAIHHVSKETFMKSYAFYRSRPDMFKVVTDTLYNRSLRNRERIMDPKQRKKME